MGWQFLIFDKDSTWWNDRKSVQIEYVSLINSKLYWNCATWKFIKKYRCPTVRNWRQWCREVWSETSIRILIPETRELRQDQWSRVAGDYVMLKEDKENALNGKQKVSVRAETSVVSDTMEMNGGNRLQNPLHPPFHQHQDVEVRREKEVPEAAVLLV